MEPEKPVEPAKQPAPPPETPHPHKLGKVVRLGPATAWKTQAGTGRPTDVEAVIGRPPNP